MSDPEILILLSLDFQSFQEECRLFFSTGKKTGNFKKSMVFLTLMV